MTTPAIIAICATLLSMIFWSVFLWRRNRAARLWLQRDAAMTSAFHDYIAQGRIEEAREIRQHCRREFEKMFKR